MVLTREQIKEGNEKLAKILGWFQEDGYDSWFEITEFAKYVAFPIHNNDLPFHRDWNYLMKVVDKIGTLVYHRDGDAPEWNWKEHYSLGELFHHMWNKWLRVEQAKKGEFNLMNDLESVWSACVAYVDWYNSNENTKDE
jgi:hypothetical protein